MENEFKTIDKLQRLVKKYPNLKETIKDVCTKGDKRDKLKGIVDIVKNSNNIVIIGRDSEEEERYYELAYIMSLGYIKVRHVTTIELLDNYLHEDEEVDRLTQVVSDIVVIRDSRAYVPNKQKSNFITQVIEQNKRTLYYYVGTYPQFSSEHSQFEAYIKDRTQDPIRIISTEKKAQEDII